MVTSGEPAGIGPDIVAGLARHPFDAHIAVVADPDLILERASQLGTALKTREYRKSGNAMPHTAGSIEVIPVNRVLAVLADQGRERVESPGHALKIAETLGADALLVFAVTEFDAYEPPVVGLAAQLYGRRRHPRTVRFDPVAESRAAAPLHQWVNASPMAPIAQAERVFDASHERVCKAVRRFAESRSADKSPFGWRKYIASQQSYLRFCCHETIRAMTRGPTPEMESDGEDEQPWYRKWGASG